MMLNSLNAARACVRTCVLALLLVSAVASVAQAQGVAQAAKVRGDVVMMRGGADQPVVAGTAFQLRDQVRTGAKARLQIAFSDGSVVTLGENSTLSIDRFSGTPGASRNVALTVLSGIVDAVAAKSSEAKFDYQLRTPNSYSAVRGTHWIVAVESAISRFFVVEGLVEVGTLSGSRTVVAAGDSVTVSSESGLGAPQPIAPDVLNQLTDATDAESASAAPAVPEAPAAAPAEQEQEDQSESGTPAPAKTDRQKSGGGGGGGGGGHGM